MISPRLTKVKYTGHATASGAGRNGHAISKEEGAAPLDLKLATPKALGGNGNGHNPEQLFAAGYAGEKSLTECSAMRIRALWY